MKLCWLILILAGLTPGSILARDWQFSQPVVVAESMQGVFHHLGASSRRAIAVSKNIVAVVWEDNRDGTPHIYAALKSNAGASFGKSIKISTQGPAYEPGIAALGDGRFVVGWEADNRLWLRLVAENTLGEISAVSNKPARQVAMVPTFNKELVAVWTAQVGKPYLIHYAKIQIKNQAVKVINPIQVDTTGPDADQLYPSIYVSKNGTVVAWEDRRFGNTRIFTSFANLDGQFSKYQLLNDFRPSRVARFGQGSGAMRVALDGNRKNMVAATWLDKRFFEGGYDVYAALSQDGGKTFGEDEVAQDMFGENTPQWHNAVAVSHDSKVVIAWDDSRDGPPHVWFSERIDGEWNADGNITDTDDEIKESHPVICFDGQERLHVAYVEQQQGSTRVMYVRGER